MRSSMTVPVLDGATTGGGVSRELLPCVSTSLPLLVLPLAPELPLVVAPLVLSVRLAVELHAPNAAANTVPSKIACK
jgi:hypothetical protein